MRRWSSPLVAAVGVGLGATCLWALDRAGGSYDDFAIRLQGVDYIHETELAFFVWYGLWGTLASTFFALALMQTELSDRLVQLCARLAARPWPVVGLAALVVAVGALAVHHVVLLGHPVADDELVYAFQAQTLARGRIVNPLPPVPELFHNQFMLLNEHGWYGKYPIGHPLLLALGELVGLRVLVPPVLGALSLVLTFLVGRRLFDVRRAVLGAGLLGVSPQFVWTHATQLSQTTSCFFTLLGIWSLLRLSEDARPRWAALAGLAWGMVLLARPMPGAPFLVAAFVGWLALRGSIPPDARDARTAMRQLVVAAPGVLLGVGLVLWVNTLQSGTATESGYALAHGDHSDVLPAQGGSFANSFGAALLRQNFWLFGWTFALLPVLFARPRRAAVLFWGVVAAEYSYRLLVPKTVVASTGPIYVFEIVPLLALAVVDGAARISALLGRLDVARARAWVGAVALAACVVALSSFVPKQLEVLERSSRMRDRVYLGLRHEQATRALVFANKLVEPEWGATWAYHPPNPSPDLDDEIVFARLPLLPGGVRRIYDFWRAEFPDRRAFVYFDAPRELVFEELDPRAVPAEHLSLADVLRAREEGPSHAP